MKKLLFLSLISCAIISTTANAQSGPSPSNQSAKQQPAPQFTPEQQAAMLKEAKEKQAPMLVEKAGLTQAQAEKVIEINFEIRNQAATTLAGLNDADRSAKLAELKALKEKKYSEVLSAEQIKAVYAAYEEMGRNMQKKG
ncbi:MAG TPA: hypothetical protein VGO58_02780 [Chitinophagaceae bacterium]|jgi:hypothetical protein|nr:hypothetical protein [Chitinophagaceae bacterium]